MHRFLAFLIVIVFCVVAAGQDEFAEDRKLIEQAAKQLAKSKPAPKASLPMIGSDQYAYRPGGSILPKFDFSQSANDYDRILRAHYKRDEVATLIEADSARVIPKGIEESGITYPRDWKERVKKREKYKDGSIAKSEPDKDGKYLVLYDISDIIYEAPNFPSSFGDHLENIRRAYRVQREYDRWGHSSYLFEEYQDPKPERKGPHYSRERAEAVVELIDAFLQEKAEEGSIQIIGPTSKESD